MDPPPPEPVDIVELLRDRVKWGGHDDEGNPNPYTLAANAIKDLRAELSGLAYMVLTIKARRDNAAGGPDNGLDELMDSAIDQSTKYIDSDRFREIAGKKARS